MAWFRRSLALRLFGGAPREFRRAAQEYSDEDNALDALLENLWHGVLLGSEKGLKEMIERQHVTPTPTGGKAIELKGGIGRCEWAAS